MDGLMEDLEALMSGTLPLDLFIGQVAQLMQAMATLIGCAKDDATRLWAYAEYAESTGSAEEARMLQGAALKSNAEAIVGTIYEGEMALAILIRAIDD